MINLLIATAFLIVPSVYSAGANPTRLAPENKAMVGRYANTGYVSSSIDTQADA